MNQPSKIYPEGLKDAFQTFNQLSTQLADSYRVLEGQVAQLNQELASAHQQRVSELTEKERLANRLTSLLDALPGGVVVLDNEGIVQDHNPAASELLGEPLGGIAWVEVISRAFTPRGDDGHEISLTDGRRVNISTCPLGNEPGQILLITDVTEMRRLQDKFNQHQRLADLGEMAASLAHQIRTPLSSALLYVSNLKRPDLSTLDRFTCGEKILSRLKHLEQLVNDMLLYARNGYLCEEKFNVTELLELLSQILSSQLQSTYTEFEWHDKTNGKIIQGNRQMILSALVNLATNSMQAMGKKGCLKVIASTEADKTIAIKIIDTGTGVSASTQEQIFNPFFTTRSEGTGLGLAVVRAIAKAHNGEIELENSSSKGTTFVLHLPIRQRRQTDSQGKIRREDSGMKNTIAQVFG